MDAAALADSTSTLSPLPTVLKQGLPAIAVLGIISFFSSSALFAFLAHRLFFQWRRKAHGVQLQFVFLIFNLLFADIQQSVAFMLNLEWIVRNEILVGGRSCFVQGWFVSVGDLASGAWALAIGFHTFASVAFSYRLSATTFYIICACIWIFVYTNALIGVFMYPSDIYVRAGAWCWINTDYTSLRLWAHYFWIFLAEFGTVIIYASLFLILHLRIKSNYFCPEAAIQAQRAAKLMVIYPVIYVVCTLPLASARMASITGHEPGLAHMTVAGAMITSNGWLDVVVYALTRRVVLFADAPPEDSTRAESDIIDTFYAGFHIWGNQQQYGTTTIIEACVRRSYLSTGPGGDDRLSRQDSTELLFGDPDRTPIPPPTPLKVKTETTVLVKSEPMELDDFPGFITPPRSRTRMDEKERSSFESKGTGSSNSGR